MTIYKKKNKKRNNLTLKNNNQSGGAARASAPIRSSHRATHYGPPIQNPLNPLNLDIQGLPITKYLSVERYDSHTNYSDHSPILYEINPYIKIITWNVANFGNITIQHSDPKIFNHKFYLDRTETLNEYVYRLVNIIYALRNLINTHKTQKGHGPMIFCQELPQLYHGQITQGNASPEAKYQTTLINLFSNLLESNNLTLIGDSITECNVIVDSDDIHTTTEKLIFLPENDINPGSGNLAPRYNYFYKNAPKGLVFYVNVHMKFSANFNTEINTCIDLIYKYCSDPLSPKKLSLIYFIGDFNRSLVSQQIVLNNLFNRSTFNYLQDSIIKGPGYKIYSTQEDASFSLGDNSGKKNATNVDYILQIIF